MKTLNKIAATLLIAGLVTTSAISQDRMMHHDTTKMKMHRKLSPDSLMKMHPNKMKVKDRKTVMENDTMKVKIKNSKMKIKKEPTQK